MSDRGYQDDISPSVIHDVTARTAEKMLLQQTAYHADKEFKSCFHRCIGSVRLRYRNTVKLLQAQTHQQAKNLESLPEKIARYYRSYAYSAKPRLIQILNFRIPFTIKFQSVVTVVTASSEAFQEINYRIALRVDCVKTSLSYTRKKLPAELPNNICIYDPRAYHEK